VGVNPGELALSKAHVIGYVAALLIRHLPLHWV
jgi:hypothetical protein